MTDVARLDVPHVVRGRTLVPGGDAGTVDFPDFRTPALDLDALVWPRAEPGPAFDLPVAEIIDFLAAVGDRLDLDTNPYLQYALEQSVACSSLGPRILERTYRDLKHLFDPKTAWFQVDQEIGREALDGWKEVVDLQGRVRRVRAFPPRLVHVLAGNTPGVTAATVVRGALCKGVHLLKLPSNDLFTGSAVLRTLADVDPGHPVTRSFSCVYWRGGDATVESALFRAQYFDRLVAWGGDAAIRNAIGYVAPGFELVSFDPKVSISLLGREALGSEEVRHSSAAAAAEDTSLFNQEVCAASRFIYAEDDADGGLAAWCADLARALATERTYADAVVPNLPADIRAEVEVLRTMSPDYEVFGAEDGSGLVVLSDDPVDFHPSGKTVNVVRVPSLDAALDQVNVATQTIGIYPAARAEALRDRLASRGMQRLVPLGEVVDVAAGLPHDGFYPLARFVKWLVDDC
ncbi:long-chain-fatty-acyl-CoA reductase [Frankia sp. CcI49]|uniref:acyl-CoA reductase n=1 Tax=Frankia sp. CcI49 TaxID=1745382 RepID=UPI000976B3B9|nr:acyl-CoA reductase [Frankia sp. CcI49]ONH58884.1 long-chain-fatty-acyl-CoA reductase [Frankia sp. CcI49]